MKEYEITMPFTGVATLFVEAASKDEALEKFYDETGKLRVTGNDNVDIQWEFTNNVTKGNVFYGMQNDMEIIENEIQED